MATRSEISALTAATLTAASIVPPGNVWRDRNSVFANDEFPAINILIPGITDNPRSVNVQAFSRIVDVEIEGWTTGADDVALADAVDSLGASIAAALLTDDAWLEPFEKIEGVKTEYATGVLEGRRRGAVKVTISTRHHVKYTSAMVTAAADLDSVDVTADLDGDGTAQTVRDLIPIEVAP